MVAVSGVVARIIGGGRGGWGLLIWLTLSLSLSLSPQTTGDVKIFNTADDDNFSQVSRYYMCDYLCYLTSASFPTFLTASLENVMSPLFFYSPPTCTLLVCICTLDFGHRTFSCVLQVNTFWTKVLSEDERIRLVQNIAGHLKDATEFIQQRAARELAWGLGLSIHGNC